MDYLPRLLQLYATATNRALTTVGRLAGGRGDVAKRAAAGTITMARAARIVQWLSDHWPADLPWPTDIPRPPPSADSPAAASADDAASRMAADPDAEVRRYRKAMSAAIDRNDWGAAEAVEREMHAAALSLAPDGRIASAKALCLALHISRDVYDDVVRRYRNGAAKGRPRPGTDTEKMLRALEMSGDARFAPPPCGLRMASPRERQARLEGGGA